MTSKKTKSPENTAGPDHAVTRTMQSEDAAPREPQAPAESVPAGATKTPRGNLRVDL